MTWFGYVLIVWFGMKPVAFITAIGKPRTPITRQDAVLSLLISAAVIVGLVTLGTNT